MRAFGFYLAASLQVVATAATALPPAGVAEAVIQGLIGGDSSASIQDAADASPIQANRYFTSENWAGTSRSGKDITFSTATVKVPHFETDPDGWTTGLAIFSAMDGYFSNPGNLALGGIIIAARREERQYQFTAIWRVSTYGGGSENEISFPIRAGHTIRMSLHRLSQTSINSTVENLSTGQTVYRILDSPTPYLATDASWVVNRYTSMGKYMRWLEFTDPIKFTDVKAVTAAGETLTLDGADVFDVVTEDKKQLTKCAVGGLSDFTCQHQ